MPGIVEIGEIAQFGGVYCCLLFNSRYHSDWLTANIQPNLGICWGFLSDAWRWLEAEGRPINRHQSIVDLLDVKIPKNPRRVEFENLN